MRWGFNSYLLLGPTVHGPDFHIPFFLRLFCLAIYVELDQFMVRAWIYKRCFFTSWFIDRIHSSESVHLQCHVMSCHLHLLYVSLRQKRNSFCSLPIAWLTSSISSLLSPSSNYSYGKCNCGLYWILSGWTWFYSFIIGIHLTYFVKRLLQVLIQVPVVLVKINEGGKNNNKNKQQQQGWLRWKQGCQ